jgi:hypothetical protein
MLKFLERNSSASVTVVSEIRGMETFGWDGFDGGDTLERGSFVMCQSLLGCG